ncbi:MAG: FKBP-type peptidyl-prolyl cis-trans isomerase SlyD [Elusimicrobia bacterium]|nr:MAG: FKBP-type peptidyl-prolyl cis-trans isomerase SlyD [Elusimicrobiota bacterium]
MKKTAAVLVAALALACSKGGAVTAGSEVRMHYTLTVEGAVVDSSVGKAPFPYKHGAGMIVPGLEAQMAGHRAGDKFTARVEAKDGYGVHNPAGVKTVPWKAFGGKANAARLKPGELVSGEAGGRPFQAKVVRLEDAGVVLDLNHPLAGKTLEFAVEIIEVKSPT